MEAAKYKWAKEFEEIKKIFTAYFEPFAKAYVFYFVANNGSWVTQDQIDSELQKYGYSRTDSFALCCQLQKEGKFDRREKPKLAYRIMRD